MIRINYALRFNSPFTSRIALQKMVPSKCIDCLSLGHYSRAYYKCRLYTPIEADDVGTSGTKRKQSAVIKDEKRKTKRARNSSSSSANTTSVCTSCKKTGRKSSRPSACKNHNLNKKEILIINLGKNYQPFTIKIPLDKCVKQEFLPHLKAFAISSSRNSIPSPVICQLLHFASQQFWYSIRQMVNGKRVIQSNNLPSDMLSVWDSFKAQHRTIMYNAVLKPGLLQCLTEACTELATSYQNHTVENFETRVIKFLTYKLPITFVVGRELQSIWSTCCWMAQQSTVEKKRSKKKSGRSNEGRKKEAPIGNRKDKWRPTKLEEEDKNKVPLIVFGNVMPLKMTNVRVCWSAKTVIRFVEETSMPPRTHYLYLFPFGKAMVDHHLTAEANISRYIAVLNTVFLFEI
ncbi:hypothetical protein EDC94DRAFT_589625 [Helicostylum pulchrum]|nr:hypothetical protein EDC94DRAFT_589625 [Helicostylum pulchrum]